MSLSSLAASENSFRRLWRRPRYPSFLLTVSLSRTTAGMFNTAGVLLVLQRTGSAPLAGLTAAAAVVPGALTGPLLGAWLDVAHRRRVLIVADQLLSVAGLLGIVALAGRAPGVDGARGDRGLQPDAPVQPGDVLQRARRDRRRGAA